MTSACRMQSAWLCCTPPAICGLQNAGQSAEKPCLRGRPPCSAWRCRRMMRCASCRAAHRLRRFLNCRTPRKGILRMRWLPFMKQTAGWRRTACCPYTVSASALITPAAYTPAAADRRSVSAGQSIAAAGRTGHAAHHAAADAICNRSIRNRADSTACFACRCRQCMLLWS